MKNLFYILIISLIITIPLKSAPEKSKKNDYDSFMANYYYYVKSLVFSKDMIVKEQFLISLLKSVEEEMENRTKANKRITLPSEEDFNKLSQDLTILNYSIDDTNLNEMMKGFKDNILQEYNLKLLKARLLKSSLIESASEEGKFKMFTKDLKLAIKQYSKGVFNYSYFLFNEILSTYNYKNMEDILFFKAECLLQLNNISESLRVYKRIVDEFPDSPYASYSFDRLINFYYIKGDFEKSLNEYEEFLKVNPSKIEDSHHYVAGLSAYKLSRLNKIVEIFDRIEEKSDYYNQAIYLKANALTIKKQYTVAKDLYLSVKKGSIIRSEDIRNLVYEGALLKLGYLSFNLLDQKKMTSAGLGGVREAKSQTDFIKEAYSYFDRISDDSKYYEDALMGKAWVEHNLGDYSKSNQFIEELLVLNPNTDFLYEARTLLGYNKELSSVLNETNEDYEYVLQAHLQLNENKKFINERIGYLSLIKELNELRTILYEKYSPTQKFVEYFKLKEDLMILLKKSELFLQGEAKKNENIAYITETNYKKSVLKKIVAQTRREVNRLEELNLELSRLKESMIRKSNFKDASRVNIVQDEVLSSLRKADILDIYSDNKLKKVDSRKIDLQRWSDLSFLKYI